MTNVHIEAARNLIASCSIETTPNVYAKYGKFSDLVDKKSNIYVTYLPDEDMNKVIDTAKKLTLEGYNVIPHLPARTISNNDELEKYIKSLSEESGCSKILVIGGGGNQKGSIKSSIETVSYTHLTLPTILLV